VTILKVKKRDGRVVDFEREKVIQAIFKAAKAVGGENMELAKQLSGEVIRNIEQKFHDQNPSVEDVQDEVEKVLIEKGHAKTAKAYILYREERGRIREAKEVLGVRDELKLSVNTIKVLKARYLLKDEEGNVKESTGELFMRIARHVALPDILYHDLVFDINKEQTVKEVKALEGLPEKAKELNLNINDVRMLYRAYKRMNLRKQMKCNFMELMEILRRRWEDIKPRIEQIFNALIRFEFTPNSPTLMNAGAKLGQLSACFVLPVGDSLESIFDSLKHTALIHQSGGGTGFSFSNLRYKGDMVKSTKGIASGPLSFMRVFDVATDVIKQGGKRRGANMGILSIHHPDIIEFITSKDSENKILTNFNISVGLTDEFMKALAENGEYELRNPRSGEVVKKLYARQVWEMITYHAWKTGDPGIIFLDEMNRHNQTPHIGAIEATNPCIAKDNWVHTENGPFQVKDLIGTQFKARVNGMDMLSGDQGFFKTANKEVYKLKTKEGYALRLTDNHPVLKVKRSTRYTTETEWCKAGDLEPNDKIMLHNHKQNTKWKGKNTEEEGYLMGLLIGDGTLKKDKTVLSVWNNPNGIMEEALKAIEKLPHRKDFKGWVKIKGRNEHRMSTIALKSLAESMRMEQGNKAITPRLEKTSSDFYKGFLRGFFDSDGSVIGTQTKGVSVRLAQSDLTRLEAVQRMLLRLGIASTIYKNRRKQQLKELPDGKGGKKKYMIKDQHELVISGENIRLFSEKIGFSDLSKASKLELALNNYKRSINKENYFATVSEIVSDGIEDVYDVHVPGVNIFDANGMQIHNCGEQTLLSYESCNLGSINLSKMLTEGNEIDWDKIKRTTELATHFLDSVIDANKYPIQQIEFMTLANRRIGLGVMGFAEMLIRMGIPYASDKALDLAGKIMKFVTESSREYSERLGETRGNFPNFRGSIWDTEGKKHMRNCAVTTIAPTGTISIIANTSSGIEPLFAVVFVRRNVLGGETELLEINPLFEKYAKEHGFFSEELMKQVSKTGSLHGIEGIPEEAKRLFVTAHDIDPEWHIKMQAAFQKYTDNAVSKTINLRAEAGIKDVEDAYLLAHKLGCKGITIYRDSSKTVQVIHLGKGKKEDEKESINGNGHTEEGLTESKEACPVCKAKLYCAEGCFTCLSCGYSKCS